MRLHSQFRWQRVAHRYAPVSAHALRSSTSGGAAPAAAAAPQQQQAAGKGDGVDPAADWHVRLLQTASKARDRPKKKKAPRFPEWNSDNFLEEDEEFNEGDAGTGGPRGPLRRGPGAAICRSLRRAAIPPRGGPPGRLPKAARPAWQPPAPVLCAPHASPGSCLTSLPPPRAARRRLHDLGEARAGGGALLRHGAHQHQERRRRRGLRGLQVG
jgi:hypothetical protein